MLMVWPAVIAAGASIAGSAMASKNAGGFSKGFQKQVYADTKVREDTAIQRRVADAKAAGIHPLFAMGNAGASSGGFVGQSASGSHLGDGIANAGAQIARGMRASDIKKRQSAQDEVAMALNAAQIRNLNSRSDANDWATEQAKASAMKTAEGDVWSTGAGRGDSLNSSGVGNAEARTYPIGTKLGRPVNQRPLTQTSRRSIPERIEFVGKDGERYQILNPEGGMDEIGQADYLLQKAQRAAYRKMWKMNRDRAKLKARRKAQRKQRGSGGGW